MPKNVRNFWIELVVDGKKTKVATGPRSKSGGFSLTVKQRDLGGIRTAVEVVGRVNHKTGRITTAVHEGASGVELFARTTDR